MFDDEGLIARERALESLGKDRLVILPALQRAAWLDWETIRSTSNATACPVGMPRGTNSSSTFLKRRQALILRRHGQVMWWHDLQSEGLEPPQPATLPLPAPSGPLAPATVRTRREQEADREAQ